LRALLLIVLASQDPYPLSHQLRTLEQDLTSADYKAVLGTMIPTDLDAEWLRVATPDNYHVFVRQQGGAEAVAKDPVLQKAFERRKRIATEFLELLRPAFASKKKKPPFDDAAALTKALERADRRGEATPDARARILPVLAAPDAEKHWPAFRGPTGRGIVLDARLPKDWNVAWKTRLPGPGASSPVIWGDRLIVTSEGPAAEPKAGPARLILCHDRRDGKALWQHAAPAPRETEKPYGKNNYAPSTPVTDGERVIVFFGNSGLVCCDLEGKRLWNRDLGLFTTTHGPGTSPVLYKDLVILIQDQNRGTSLCAAFDKRTGEERWRRERKSTMCWTSPVLLRVDDRDELVYSGSHAVISYDPATGDELWRVAGPSNEAVPMIATGGGLLFSTSGRNGPTLAIRPGGRGDVTETHLVWKNETGGPHVPSPAYHDGHLYLAGDTGILACLEAATGKTLYQQRLRGRFTMSPLVVGDTLLLVNEDGLCSLIKAGSSFELAAEHDLKEPVLATPAVLDGRIYFRTRDHLLCIGERQ